MSDFILMEPSNQTYQGLLSNGVTYNVPRFQRDYAWDQEQWEDLWADIETLDEEQYHYMGYIVLQRKGQHEFEVIDGQQRLVTLSLIVLASMRKIHDLVVSNNEAQNNEERLKEITGRFIGSKNLVTLRVSSKLTLNRNNHQFYKEICSNLNAPNPISLTSTNTLLKHAFDFFYAQNMGVTGSEIGEFIDKFTSRMIFTKIIVRDSLNAYKVFETLNARGVKLSTPDLLKNYIFSMVACNDDVSDETLNDMDESWALIIAQLGENNFTDFIRYHYNFQHKSVSKKNLFKSVRHLYDQSEKACAYLASLKEYVSIYVALLNPYDEWWSRQGDVYQEARFYLEGLQLFGIKQPFTILMIAFKKFSAIEFIKTLKYLYILSIRYNLICRHSPNEQEQTYNLIANNVYNEQHQRASHIKNSKEFRQLYPDDKTFQNALEFYKMPSRRSSKKIRFLLAEIENRFGRKVSYLNTSLEHICPYNPDQDWYDYFGHGIHDISDRLGNMVLLEKDELKRDDFNTKKVVYMATPFRLANKVAEYDTWDLQNLNRYQAWLADQGVKTWKVD